MIKSITPFLWFDKNAEEAINFYTSVFPNSKIISINRYPDGPLEGPMAGMEGKVLTAVFELDGQKFMALDGGPIFKFTEAVSFFVSVETQEEIDELWGKLSAHPDNEQCGWLKDKFGLSWQIIPTAMGELMGDPDPVKSKRVMEAMLQMKKIDIATLQKAHDQ
jgi:predicted 3-demethylubiquinone-9 3-methyltransferase (glyoxalase superfamily)